MRPGISFDLDGVLIQNPFGRGVGPRVRTHIRQSPRLRTLPEAEANSLIDQAIRKRWGEHMASGDFVAAYDWDTVYSSVSRDFDWHPVPDVATLVEGFCTDPDMIALLPGAKKCLEALQQDYCLYAATNGYRAYQWPVLESLHIAHFFEDILTPDGLGYAKPDPRFFKTIPNLEIHVGDTLLHDVLGANQANLLSVWVAPDLPASLLEYSPPERPCQQGFNEFLSQNLEATLYRKYHPEADTKSCQPDAVVVNVGELPEWLVQR